jgi:hypothetical protein
MIGVAKMDVIGPNSNPIGAPMTYPGKAPELPAVLLLDDSLLGLRPSLAAPVGRWLVECDREMPLDEALLAEDAAPMASRHPVLAVGSNASPAQVHRKFTVARLRPVVPITAVKVTGLSVGVSAHVSKAGYVPATPVFDPAAVSDLHVTWLDGPQLAAMDRTEPNYLRVQLLPANSITLPSGQTVHECWVYVSRHGHLVDRSGQTRQLTDQATLIAELIADVPELQDIAGTSPAEWLKQTRSAVVRDRIRQALRLAGLARDQPERD